MASVLFSTPERRFYLFAALLTAARLAAIIVSDVELGPDEAQYWYWSQTPAFGYFSKPPLIAWTIAATTAIAGSSEWAIRLAAPFFQLGAAFFLFKLARRLADSEAAFWAGVSWLILPGVVLSASLITTDGPLIFFWSAALYFFFRLTEPRGDKPRFAIAAGLGAAIGLGFLSKYAMTYFPLGALLCLALSAERRRRLRLSEIALALGFSVAIIAPNLLWNAANDFQTISHTAANANWSRNFGHPGKLAKFLADQIGVAGPISLVLIMIAGFAGLRAAEGETRERTNGLIAFAAPALLIVSTQAFISRAHGNWAAVAYPSLIVMMAIWARQHARGFLALKASSALHLIIGVAYLAAYANSAIADATGAGAAFKRLRGWRAHAADLVETAKGYDAVIFDDRETIAEFIYYARGGPRIATWNSNHRIDSHFEVVLPLDPARDRRLLFVTREPNIPALELNFKNVRLARESVAPVTPSQTRKVYFFEVWRAPE